jgi:hypothetical protein
MMLQYCFELINVWMQITINNEHFDLVPLYKWSIIHSSVTSALEMMKACVAIRSQSWKFWHRVMFRCSAWTIWDSVYKKKYMYLVLFFVKIVAANYVNISDFSFHLTLLDQEYIWKLVMIQCSGSNIIIHIIHNLYIRDDEVTSFSY